MTKTTKAPTRRDALKLATTGVAAAGAMALGGKAAIADDLPTANAGGTYRETDHVKTYYETLKF